MLADSHSRGPLSPPLPNSPIERVAILVAMPEEAALLIKSLSLTEFDAGFDPDMNVKCYSGFVENREIFLVVNDVDPDFGVAPVGTDFAAINTYETIRLLNPDTIISAGTAGGYAERGAQIGDVYLSEGSIGFHDRRIECGPDYLRYGQGNFPCLSAPVMANALRLKTGIISTGNSLSISTQDQQCINQIGAVAKDMEAGTIANIARRKKVRFLAIKAITNLASVNANAGEEFQKNFDIAVAALAEALPGVLRFILGKTPQQLAMPITLLVNHSILKSPEPQKDEQSQLYQNSVAQ